MIQVCMNTMVEEEEEEEEKERKDGWEKSLEQGREEEKGGRDWGKISFWRQTFCTRLPRRFSSSSRFRLFCLRRIEEHYVLVQEP